MKSPSPSAAGRVHLLLSDAVTRRPVLEGGLPWSAIHGAPQPPEAPYQDDAPHWDAPSADPDDLRLQRWGVVAPEGGEGDRMLEALAPLVRLREEEQGAPATVYRVAPGMDARAAVAWKHDTYQDPAVLERERPRYVLIAGDLDHVSLELQQTLANSALVGRVHFSGPGGALDLDGYRAYAAKVVDFASRPVAEADLCFYAARDDDATRGGHERLVTPCLEDAEKLRGKGYLPAKEIREITVDLQRAGAGPRPAVLLSVSHGLGTPRRGWASAEEQRARQGTLLLGGGVELGAGALRAGPFLPGGVWFCVACFSAGTPAVSVYAPWIAQLAAHDASYRDLLDSIPRGPVRPFLAAMPQAALANPRGPLAVIGHVDQAWSYSFIEPYDPKKKEQRRHGRMLSVLTALMNGHRAGNALQGLVEFYKEINGDLQPETVGSPAGAAERAHLWMLRNDLRGYLLLGDPAARLPLQRG